MSTNQTSSEHRSFGKRERLLLAALLLIIGVFYLQTRSMHAVPAGSVVVSVMDETQGPTIVKTFSLNRDTTYTIVTGPSGDSESQGTNLLVIENGKAWIKEANCPNQDCVKQGAISLNGEMLVCLPHKITVSITE